MKQYQYDQSLDKLTIVFSELVEAGDSGAVTARPVEELHGQIGLLFTEDGKLRGLEVAPATKYFEAKQLEGLVPKSTVASTDTNWQALSKADYLALEAPVIFEDQENDGLYGSVSKGNLQFKFGWIREAVQPSVSWLSEDICAIGVDKHFSLVNFQTGTIALSPALDSYFVDTYLLEDTVLVACQLEVIQINRTDLAIESRYELPGFFVDLKIQPDGATVNCFDGSVIKIP